MDRYKLQVRGGDGSPFVGTPSYLIEGTGKKIQEREFSEETRTQDPDRVSGFILENAEGQFLSAALVWVSRSGPREGYLHNVQVVRSLVQDGFPNGMPSKAYPASSTYEGTALIISDPISYEQLAATVQ